MATLDDVAVKIIKEQALVIGPLAWDEARKVNSLTIVNQQPGEVHISSEDPKTAIDQLVARFERLFGRASQEVCKEAAAALLVGMQIADIPVSLRS